MNTTVFYYCLLALLAVALGRDLEAMWDVSIYTSENQQISYSTGPGTGNNPSVKITIWDKCQSESLDRTQLGELYPASTVPGLQLDTSGVVHQVGQGINTVAFTFVNEVESNVDIYTDHGDNTATISFCAQVGIYSDDDLLLNSEQVPLLYHISFTKSFFHLSGLFQMRAKDSQDAPTPETSPDSPLDAYFCDAETQTELRHNNLAQGSSVSICFTVFDSQFEVSDITDLVVEDLSGTSEQLVVSGGSLFSAEKSCTPKLLPDGSNVNICVLTLPLEAKFFDFTALTLTGMGSGVLKRRSGASSGQKNLLRHLNNDEDDDNEAVETVFYVKPVTFRVVAVGDDIGSTGISWGVHTSVSAMLAAAIFWFC